MDHWILASLNRWGVHEHTVVSVCSNDLVYAVILVSALWFVFHTFEQRQPLQNYRKFTINLITKSVILFVVPVGIATLISELISQVYVRPRPFSVMPEIKLLVPHSADGGMPSHHMVFMVALVTMIYSMNHRLAFVLGLLTLMSGIARIAAGIHYPSDVIAGLFLGSLISTLYLRVGPVRKMTFFSTPISQ